jgi:hypothetical protein
VCLDLCLVAPWIMRRAARYSSATQNTGCSLVPLLHRFRRLTVRYERRAALPQAFHSLGCALLCWQALQR